MKRFWIKLAVIILPFIFLLLILNFAFRKSYYWDVYYTEQFKFREVPNNIQITNLGSSLGFYGFVYDDFPQYNCFNFAVSWQHHKYNYCVLNQYIDNLTENAVVFIPISYFDITRIEDEPLHKYYKILDRENFPDWSVKGYLNNDVFPFLFTKEPWKKIMMKKETSPVTMYETVNLSEAEVINSSKVMYETFTKDNGAEQGEKGFEYNINEVSKIIDLCYSKKLVPVLVGLPQIDKLNDLFEETDFFETFYRFTDTLQQKYPEILYFDYSCNEEYSSDWSLFFDATHLNSKGAKKFTAQVIEDLKNNNLLK